MDLGETFQVAIITEKLPPTLKNFKSYFKHKRKEMSLENMIIKLQVKEGNKINHKKSVIFVAKANIMEYCQNIKNKKANKNTLGPKGGVSKKQTKFQRKCFNYDKIGHKASN